MKQLRMVTPHTLAEHCMIAAELRRRAGFASGPISARALRAAAARHEAAAQVRPHANAGA